MKNGNSIDIKLVKYSTFRGHDGMRGINATIVYKGKQIATVYDDAYGGCFQYTTLGKFDTPERDENSKLFDQLIEEVKSLPPRKTEFGELPEDLDCIVSDLASALDRKKDEKKGVLIKHFGGYNIVGYNVTIPTLLKKYSDGLDCIQQIYNEEIAKGSEILNKDYLKSVGVVL